MHRMAFDHFFSLESRRYSQQAHLSICASVCSHAVKISARFIFLDPNEGGGFISKSPCFHYPKCIRDGWKRGPHEQGAAPPCKLTNRQRADSINIHCAIVLFCVSSAFWSGSVLAVAPRWVCIYDGVLFVWKVHIIHPFPRSRFLLWGFSCRNPPGCHRGRPRSGCYRPPEPWPSPECRRSPL